MTQVDREDAYEDDHLTGARSTRPLSLREMEQVTTFMLSNHDAMEEWRDFYEEEKRQRGTLFIFPSMLDYMIGLKDS